MAQVVTLANRTLTPEFEISKVITTYRVYLDIEEDGWLAVSSPDLPELVTQGENEDEAMKNAYEAVELILEERDSKKEFNLLITER